MADQPFVLLLPGLMNDGRVWHPVCRELGLGRSYIVAPTHELSGVRAIAADAIARLPAGKFVVAGFSLGGYVALEVCRQAPDRVVGLALLATSARGETPEGRQTRQRMIDVVTAASGQFGAVAEGFLPRLLHSAHKDAPNLRALLTEMAARVGSTGFMRQQTTAMQRPDSIETLRSWRKPTLILCGDEDQITPPSLSEEMAAVVEGSELVIVKQSGHMVLLEQPKLVATAMQCWLGRVGEILC